MNNCAKHIKKCLFILMQLIGIIVSIRKQINLDAQKKLNKKIKKQFMSCESIN